MKEHEVAVKSKKEKKPVKSSKSPLLTVGRFLEPNRPCGGKNPELWLKILIRN